jgi:hypothetical protein
MHRPSESEYAPAFRAYVERVTENEIIPVLRLQLDELENLLGGVTAERETYRYAPDKWSIREVAGHLVDGERVFGYRAFSIARGESQSLPGFDEKAYMLSAPYDRVALEDLLSEFRLVRLANIAMLRNLDEDAWRSVGTANNAQVSVRALAFIMAGHMRHHMGVLRERYELG